MALLTEVYVSFSLQGPNTLAWFNLLFLHILMVNIRFDLTEYATELYLQYAIVWMRKTFSKSWLLHVHPSLSFPWAWHYAPLDDLAHSQVSWSLANASRRPISAYRFHPCHPKYSCTSQEDRQLTITPWSWHYHQPVPESPTAVSSSGTSTRKCPSRDTASPPVKWRLSQLS